MVRTGPRDGTRKFAVAVLASLATFFVPATPAQDTLPTPEYTLHAYANLVQIPVLVLSFTRDRLSRAVPPNRFALSIDAGPWFRPTHVRPEGDDPIALSIVLDTRGDSAELLPHIADQLAALAPEYLHPSDRATIYSIDCGLMRSANNLPIDADILLRGTHAALASWQARIASRTQCPNKSVPLQQVLLKIVSAMEKLPGRRVILLISQGEEEVDKPSWREVAEAAQNAGTAMFAIAPGGVQLQQLRDFRFPAAPQANTLNMVCEFSGGTLVLSTSHDLPGTLRDFTRTLRERYIIDFPRPANATAGRHSLQVRIDKSADFIRPAGVSIPIADPSVLADPTTVPSDPSLTPVQGDHTNLLPH